MMQKIDIRRDFIKAEQGMWFVQSDINNVIQKLEASQANKDDLMEIKKLHEHALKLANNIKQAALKFENEAIYE